MENIFENNKYKITYLQEESLVEFYMKDIEIEKADIINMHDETLRMTKGAKYGSIFSAKDFFSISSEASAEGSKPHYAENLIAQAFVVKNLAQRLIGNFIIKINKPVSETRVFTNYNEGKRWIENRVKTYEISVINKSNTICI